MKVGHFLGGLALAVAHASPVIAVPNEDSIATGKAKVYPVIPAETAADVAVTNSAYAPLDIRRYGAVCDYNVATETDGQAPDDATDNLAAIDAAVDVAGKLGGGVIRIQGGGDCYVSNSIDARGISNLCIYVAPGTTLRATRYTRLGTLLLLGGRGPVASGVSKVCVDGGGTLRTFQPDHAKIQAHQRNHAYKVGDYVLSTDRSGKERAYYAKRAGTSGASSPPDVINASDTDGTVIWQDADNDNVISIHGDGVRVEGMQIPRASGKPITVQVPNWSDVWIVNNRIGSTNDKGIEVKGNQAAKGQEAAFGDRANIVGNIIEWTGRGGIDVEQPSFSSVPNKNCRVIDNLVRSAGNIAAASGIRVNRCDGVEVRGNKVLKSSSNGFHIRRSKNVKGDIHSENAGASGVHLQENSGVALDYINVKNARTNAIAESRNAQGCVVGRVEVDGSVNRWKSSRGSGPGAGGCKLRSQ
jgi:hypothetical protein